MIQKWIWNFESKKQQKTVHGAPNGRKAAPGYPAGGAIWRLRFLIMKRKIVDRAKHRGYHTRLEA